MTDSFETAKVTLVTIVAPQAHAERIARELRDLGASGYTRAKVDGWGNHGARQFGLIDSANIRFDVLAGAEVARKILHSVAANAADEAIVAFAREVDAVPHRHFL